MANFQERLLASLDAFVDHGFSGLNAHNLSYVILFFVDLIFARLINIIQLCNNIHINEQYLNKAFDAIFFLCEYAPHNLPGVVIRRNKKGIIASAFVQTLATQLGVSALQMYKNLLISVIHADDTYAVTQIIRGRLLEEQGIIEHYFTKLCISRMPKVLQEQTMLNTAGCSIGFLTNKSQKTL